MGKKGFSQVVGVLIIVILILAIIGAFYGVFSSYMKKETEKIDVQTKLLGEGLKIKKAVKDSINPSVIDLTVCCATGSSKKTEISSVNSNLDIELVIDRSGSMRQSGWSMNIDGGLGTLADFENVNVPKNSYSSEYSFNVNGGEDILAVYLNWSRIEGVSGSEGSEFALNLKRPDGTWIFGSGKPGVSGKVDPPDSVGAGNEYFSGIDTKPQIVEVDNPQTGTWKVKVYGWNLRPKINQPESQDVNISVFYGSSGQISRLPTVLSIDAAKDSSKSFVSSKIEEEHIGYIVFGSYAEIKQSLTSDKSLLISAVDNTGQEGGTAIQDGIDKAINDLSSNGREDSKKIIVLLTDGQNDLGPDVVLEKANEAKDAEIIIFTIGLTGFVDQDMLSNVASSPDYYKYVPEASGLDFIFSELRSKINQISESSLLSDYFKVVFYNDTSSYTYNIKDDSLMPLEVKTYKIDLENHLENPVKVEIYPVILLRGKEVIGPLLGAYHIS